MTAIAPRPPARRTLLVLAWLLVTGAMAFAGYQQLFSTFAEYDDEGYVMISLHSFMQGHPLYSETFSQYGPAFYFSHGTLHEGLSLPVTHQVTRWKTLLAWLATAGLCSAWLFRVTQSWQLALAAFL